MGRTDSKPLPPNRLAFDHQDGRLGFKVLKAVYVEVGGLLSLSFECACVRKCAYLSNPMFSALGIPFEEPPSGTKVVGVPEVFDPDGPRDVPRVHLYTGVHLQPWETVLRIKRARRDVLAVRGTFVVDDVNYYDHRAKDTPASFFAMFRRGTSSDLWDPW